MSDPSNPAASTPAPSAPSNAAPSASPPAAVSAPPGTALSIAQQLAAGTLDTTQAGKLARAGGISTLDVANALSVLQETRDAPQDTRSDAEKEADLVDAPVAKETDFTIRYFKPGEVAQETPQLKEFDSAARAWLVGAGFDRLLGNSLITAVERVTERTATMNEAQLEQYGQTEYAKLQQVFGSELEAKLAAAGRMVSELETTKPGLRAFLKTAGVGDSAMVASMLIQQAERYWARKGR
jgi:hypothetical protein